MSQESIKLPIQVAEKLGIEKLIDVVESFSYTITLETEGEAVAKLFSHERAIAMEQLEEELREAAKLLDRAKKPEVSPMTIQQLAEGFGFDYEEILAEVMAELPVENKTIDKWHLIRTQFERPR